MLMNILADDDIWIGNFASVDCFAFNATIFIDFKIPLHEETGYINFETTDILQLSPQCCVMLNFTWSKI